MAKLPGEEDRSFWTARLDLDLPNEPVVRDVCEPCNNGPLSELDQYICSLWDRYFRRSLESGDAVVFKYDFHLLARWLLKMCFNSARVNAGWDRFAFEPLLRYIVDGDVRRASSFRVFAELQYPVPIPKEDLELIDLPDPPKIYTPVGNRVGHVIFRSADGRRKVLRAVHLSAFSFLIAFFRPETAMSEADDFVNVLLVQRPRTRLLKETASTVKLICGQENAWECAKAARRTRFRFTDETT